MARIYPAEFRRDAVALVRSSDKTVTQVARELGLNRETLRQWVKQDRIDQGELEGLTSGEREELRRLRREVAELRMERELLKQAAAFFALVSGSLVSGGVRSFFRCPSVLVACPDVRPCRTPCAGRWCGLIAAC
jgi:transposase